MRGTWAPVRTAFQPGRPLGSIGESSVSQVELVRPSAAMARSPLLLIDDNAENLQLLERMLDWAGYARIKCCGSAQEGLAALPVFKPDLIILDLRMPVMDGYAFLERLRDDSSLG